MDSSEVDPADAVVAGVGDIEVLVCWVNGDAKGTAELRCRRRAAIAREAPRPGPGEGGDDARRQVHPPDPLVAGVADVEVSRGNGEESGSGERGRRGRAAIAPEARDPGPGEGGDGTRCQVHPAHPVVATVADVEVPRVQG